MDCAPAAVMEVSDVRALMVMALIILILGAIGFFYLLKVSDEMEPDATQQRIDVDVSLPS